MAAIDKIYVDKWEQYLEFKDWCRKQPLIEDKYGKKVSLLEFVYDYDEPWDSCHPIFNAPCYIDAYVIRKCPFDYIHKELMINYGHYSDETVKKMYDTIMARGGGEGEQGKDSWYWLTKDAFEVDDTGKITYKANENSSYMQIKRGEIYTSPKINELHGKKIVFGKHFKCIKHPYVKFNYPFKGNWFVDICLKDVNGEDSYTYMWYNEPVVYKNKFFRGQQKYGTWDFMEEFVDSDWCSSTANVPSIKTLKRLLCKKWKFPIGTIIRVTGRYICETYEFKITK